MTDIRRLLLDTEEKIADIIQSNDLSTAAHTLRLILDVVANSNVEVDEAIDAVCEREFG